MVIATADWCGLEERGKYNGQGNHILTIASIKLACALFFARPLLSAVGSKG